MPVLLNQVYALPLCNSLVGTMQIRAIKHQVANRFLAHMARLNALLNNLHLSSTNKCRLQSGVFPAAFVTLSARRMMLVECILAWFAFHHP